MKILFAVSNENIAEAVKREYQNNYKEQLTTKNVYYFNAVIKELQNNKNYDVIVISEDLEPFANNNYDTIDKFLIDKLKTISEEAVNLNGINMPIVFITTDRHILGDFFTSKLYEIGIYNALVGNDRNIENVCALMVRPRNKQQARAYYRVNAEIESTPKEDDVREEEIKNIILHYKKLGRAEEKYVESFNNIASQYNDAQLKVIIRFLPLNVKAVLEAQSPKYQSLTTFAGPSAKASAPYAPPSYNNSQNDKNKEIKEKNVEVNTNNDRVLDQISSVKGGSNVVIPNAMNINKVRKIEQLVNDKLAQEPSGIVVRNRRNTDEKEIVSSANRFNNAFGYENEPSEGNTQRVIKRKLVAPSNVSSENNEPIVEETNSDMVLPGFAEEVTQPVVEEVAQLVEEPAPVVKRGRGRPRKTPVPTEVPAGPKRGRGRPRKVQPVVEEVVHAPSVVELEESVLPGFDEVINNVNETVAEEGVLPGFDEISETSNVFSDTVDVLPGFDNAVEVAQPDLEIDVLPGFDEENKNEEFETDSYASLNEPVAEPVEEYNNAGYYNEPIDNIRANTRMSEKPIQRYENIEYLIPADKRIASFIGTSKSGVSFIVNTLGQMLSSFNINVAILDMTKNRNSFYIYTNNDEALRNIAENSIYNLLEGTANGLKINKNLTVYTALPTNTEEFYEADKVLKTLIDNHSVVLIDCDYDTPIGYFDNSTDLFMVQNMDILTMQPLTTFLKELKGKNVLKDEKLRFISNMETKVRGINSQVLLNAISIYKDPGMAYTVELFDRNTTKVFTIPFDIEAYNKYLTSLVECDLSLNGYSKFILTSLREIAICIYPLLSNESKTKKGNAYTPPSLATTGFNSNMQNTLNQMKNKY